MQNAPKYLPKLLGASVAVAATAVVGGVATSSGTSSDWYQELDKPDWQPPPAAFPIAWTTLYAIIAAGSASALTRRARRVAAGGAARPGLKRALVLNLALNAGWCWAFFARRDLRLAQANAAALALSSADLARRVGKESRGWGRALGLYAAWCGFATALTVEIARRNPGAE
ncbi:TspO/MBR family protein [Aestuariimicrobium sp. Y1814]|uniref:TspO/MBR family protein n=1 Tax=Aestuariimicrobium sp. Y1814 TaxID=3418742 RepID=UPI003DA72718